MRSSRNSLGFLVVVFLTAPGLAADRPPNVIVFLADDLGYGDVGCNGCPDIRTPHIDALARKGLRFTNYHAASPICAPSRAAMLTGRCPPRIGMSSQVNIASGLEVEGIPGSEVTFAELAQSKGYATAVFGKWHLGSTPATAPNAQGFDEFFGFHASCVDPFSHLYYASEPWYHDLFHNRTEVWEDGVHMTDLITREALKFIEANAERPFLIYAAYNVPHYPMAAHAKYMAMYAGLPPARRVYAAMVAGMDDSIGRIMAALQARGLAEKTFVFFGSDNGAPHTTRRGEGGGSNAPFREHKRSLFDGGMHCPGIISWPGRVAENETRDQLTIGMDVFATIAEVIGAEPPPGVVIDGRSWAPLFRDAKAPGHERLFFEWANQHAVREGCWKLVENGLINMTAENRNNRAQGPDAVFLSNVEADPQERVNLAARHPDVVKRLSAAHKEWLAGFPAKKQESEK
ncbi:MAG: sulfatase-like hydrolase/transferase [Phycisphaerae bacterium]